MGLSLKEMSQMSDFYIGEKMYNELNQENQSHFLENTEGDIRASLTRYGELYRKAATEAGMNENEEYIDFNKFYEQINNL